MQGLAAELEGCVQPARGGHTSRVTDSPEYVALLHGDTQEACMEALRDVALNAGKREGLSLLVGAATATPGEALHAVYLRAEEDLSLQKDAPASDRVAA